MSEPYPADAADFQADTAANGAGGTAGLQRRSPDPQAADPAHPSAESHPDHDLSYEQAREALGEVVQALEAGGITLAESIALWERGERLANVCQRLLDGAQERLDAAIERAQQDDADY